jgi:hypothetical protein
MGEIVSLGLENYSHLSQRAELINVTQVPTNSGNAQVQLATFPKVKQKLDNRLRLIDESAWLEAGEKFLDVQRAFDWIIYKVGNDLPGGMSRIEMRRAAGGFPVRFPSYADSFNSITPFQTLEFTDLDGLRWVIILCNGLEGLKCWKFRNDSDFIKENRNSSRSRWWQRTKNVTTSIVNAVNNVNNVIGTSTANQSYVLLSEEWLGDLEQEDQTDRNMLWEIFVQGYFYYYYIALKNYDFSGFFNYNDLGQFTTFRQFSEFVNDSLGTFAPTAADYIGIMTNKLRNLFVVDSLRSISTDRTRPLDSPAGGTYRSGLAAVRFLRQKLSDDGNSTSQNLISYGEGASIGALTVGGAIAGGSIGSAFPVVGTAIGGAIGAVIGATIGVIISIFNSSSIPRWRFSVSDGNDNESPSEFTNNASNAELQATITAMVQALDELVVNFAGGNYSMQTVNRVYNGQTVEVLNWAGIGSDQDSDIDKTPLGVEGSSDVNDIGNKLKGIATACATLTAIATDKNVNTRFVAIRKGSVGSDDRVRTQSNWFNSWIFGGTADVVRKIDNGYTKTDIKKGDTVYPGEKSLDKVAPVIAEAFNTFLGQDFSTHAKNLVGTIRSNLANMRDNPINGLNWLSGEINELLQHISENNTLSEEEVKIVNQIRSKLTTLIERWDSVIDELNAEPWQLSSKTVYLSKTQLNSMKTILTNAFRLEPNTNSKKSQSLPYLFAEMQGLIEELRSKLIEHKNDFEIYDIETLSHMLVVIAKDNIPDDGIDMEAGRFYYSDAGTTNIQSLNFYSAEYANSTPLEFWRLANRLVLFTNNTIEFWDITNDFEDPLSPAYSSNVYSLTVLQNSRVRFNDMLYFIAKPVELDTFSVYSLTKNGQLQQVSYPQLDAWINKQILTDLASYNPLDKNLNYLVCGSVINYENAPMIQWHLSDRALNLNYNVMFNTFFLSDELYFLENLCYFQLNSNIAGTLSNFFNQDKTAIEAILKTVNTNFDPKKRYKSVVMFHGDVDLQDHKNFVETSVTRPNSQVVKTVKSYWNKIFEPWGATNVEDYQTIRHKFYRVSNMPWESLRNILLQPKQGERNVTYRIVGIGMGIDFQTEVRWNGFLRINNLAYEVE